MSTDLDNLRKRINELDAQLVRLLNERAETAVQIGHAKSTTGKAVYDPARERAVLDRIDALNTGPLDKGAVEDIFSGIIAACREIQNH